MHFTKLQFLLLAAVAAVASAENDLFQYIGQMPECGLSCITKEIPVSVCSTFTNSTCICTDPDLKSAIQSCVATSCESTLDALKIAKIEAEACGRPKRDRRSDLHPIIGVMMLGIAAVVFRLLAKWWTARFFNNDDWIMFVCAIFYVPFVAMGHYASFKTFGQDIWEVPEVHLTQGLKLFYVAQTFYLICLGLTKMSLLCFFLRIFPNQLFRRATWALMAITGAETVVFVLAQIFQCIPISYNWEGWKGHAQNFHCLDLNRLVVAAASISISLDFIILVLPLPLLFGLQTSWRSKAGILVMFSLGAFILVTACLRLQYIVLYEQSTNPTWDHTDVMIWSGLEVAVSMIVTSLPTIRIFFRNILPNRTRTPPGPGFSDISRSHGKAGLSAIISSHTLADDCELQPITKPEEAYPRQGGNRISYFGRSRGFSRKGEELGQGGQHGGNIYTEITAAANRSPNDHIRDSTGEDLAQHLLNAPGIHVKTTTRVNSMRNFDHNRAEFQY